MLRILRAQRLFGRCLNRSFATAARSFVVDNPYSGVTVANIPIANLKQAEAAVDKSHAVQKLWRSSSLNERKALINKVISVFESREQKIAEDITNQMGKPLKQAVGEVKTCIARARALIEQSDEALKPMDLPAPAGFMKRIVREPVGVVLALCPWNYPLLCAVNTVVAAVLAGDSVIVKHSDRTPLCANHFSDAFKEVGAPADLVQALHISHPTVAKLVRHPLISYVGFTGSVAGGQAVYKATAAHRFIDVGLELGGKDAAYVAPDANLQYAIENIVDGAMYNAGQSCCAVERVYVHRSLYTQFVNGAAEFVGKSYVLGNPLDGTTNMGPLAQPKQPAMLEQRVNEAVSKGARLLQGGKATKDAAGNGRFFQPTVLADCNQDMDVIKEENFGPILPIIPVDSDEQAIQFINSSKFGLTASVWTSDQKRADTIAPQLDVGTVYMNRCDFLDPYLPWSGRKDSGKGISLSVLGFGPLTRTKGYNYKHTL